MPLLNAANVPPMLNILYAMIAVTIFIGFKYIHWSCIIFQLYRMVIQRYIVVVEGVILKYLKCYCSRTTVSHMSEIRTTTHQYKWP